VIVHLSVSGAPDQLVELIIAAGAEIDAADNDGDTPLHVAALNGHVGTVKLLLSHGADMHKRGQLGSTALMHAATCTCETSSETVKALIDAGASLEDKDTDIGSTALILACDFGIPESVQVLIDAGADIHAARNNGSTPLHVACNKGE